MVLYICQDIFRNSSMILLDRCHLESILNDSKRIIRIVSANYLPLAVNLQVSSWFPENYNLIVINGINYICSNDKAEQTHDPKKIQSQSNHPNVLGEQSFLCTSNISFGKLPLKVLLLKVITVISSYYKSAVVSKWFIDAVSITGTKYSKWL